MHAADLAFAGSAPQAELVRDGAIPSRELTELYLERIERLDPQIRAYRVVLAEEALAISNHTGQPAAAAAVEAAPDGSPVGVQLVGRPGDEATLLAVAAQLETATGWLDRRPPLAA